MIKEISDEARLKEIPKLEVKIAAVDAAMFVSADGFRRPYVKTLLWLRHKLHFYQFREVTTYKDLSIKETKQIYIRDEPI